ncbi:MAG: carboxypeptidase regulatory-like domain-containing protein [Planctomycetes bacterium]|nr:carboxypeptidase regulatory-like domain-containing protein [Planctomycetota bacterium]
MSSVAKIAVPLLLVAAVAVAFGACDSSPVAPPGGDQQSSQPAEQDPQPNDPKPKAVTGDAAGGNTRTEVSRTDVTTSGLSHADAPQGVKGRILLPDGRPAVGVKVMLLENAMNNPIDMFLKNKTGQASPPIASAETVEDGSFALGVRKAGQKVDLRVVTEEFPEVSKSPISVRADDWIDAGDLKLEIGLTVQGRVLDATTRAAVPNATVYMSSSARSHAMVATPGREHGVAAVTDGNGFFRFTSGPRLGTINLKAEAEGFATVSLLNQQISADKPNDFSLEIERGRTITGVVVDAQGQRVSGAKVMAYGLSAKTPQNETIYTDTQGEFEFPPLRSGPYRLTASARNFADAEMPVALTDEDVKLVLQRRATVKLKVLTSKQRPVKVYRLALKRAFPQNPDAIGNVMDWPERNISPRDYVGDWAMISNLPAGDFRFQITERNHAKSLSPMFHVDKGEDGNLEVIAVLTEGAAITGTVIDGTGKPVAGATVTSDMNAGLAAGTGFFEIFQNMIPKKHTTKQVKTDSQGRFRIPQLSFADYMIRVSHPSYCEGTAINIKLTQEGQVVDAGVIELQMGTRVEGITTVNGVPTGQVKVVISMPTPAGPQGQLQPGAQMTEEQQREAAKRLFSTHVLSDGNGNYSMLKRVPPGTYKITAARHSAENPFGALLDMKESEQQLVIAPGQDKVVVNFNLSNR